MRKQLFFILITIVFITCQQGGHKVATLSEQELKVDSVIAQMKEKFGDTQSNRIEIGVKQATQFWRKDDGSADDFSSFCLENFIADAKKITELFNIFEYNFEQIFGLNTILQRELRQRIDLELGEIQPVDMLFANYDPFAHMEDDFFKTKIAFNALLNFPVYTLKQMNQLGSKWSRENWAQARLAQHFTSRVPGELQQKISEVYLAADHYISNYNICMDHLINAEGNKYFPKDLKLISHWGLRDELKAQYANKDGFERQKLIQRVMEHIIQQDIPAVVINNPAVDWNPFDNTIKASSSTKVQDASVNNTPEANERYRKFLDIFHAEKQVDPFFPQTPTLIDRKFERDREIPEQEFEALLVSILSAPVAQKIGKYIEQKLGRKLEPFDIWYDGFKSRGTIVESELDKIVRNRYTTPESFQDDIPFILRNMGFSPQNAEFIGSKIIVDPARGAGHAYGAMLRSDNAHLRTRIPETGMNYKGFNIAVHELGHNVEQVISLNRVDHTILQGVPNTAFTECFAFVFQARDLEILGVQQNDSLLNHLKILDKYWNTFEISGVSLVDMYVWHWLYDHPNATPAQLNHQVQQISKKVWNEYFAPVFGVKDQILLGIYSHMIYTGLYLPDYPLGFIISYQIEDYLKDKNLGTEMERMCSLGSITPSAWMQAAVGADISTAPLIQATEHAISVIQN